jgi:hypothetical protein
MATMIVKHHVANFDAWKEAFDSMKPIRAKFGWKGTRVLRDATDPNLVTIINQVASLEQAKQYGASPELRSGMQKAGVQGPPEISFCEDAGDTAY